MVGLRRAQVADKCGVVRRSALDELAAAGGRCMTTRSLTIDDLERWVLFGADWRLVELSD